MAITVTVTEDATPTVITIPDDSAAVTINNDTPAAQVVEVASGTSEFRQATLVVAAVDASPAEIAGADYTCDGVSDDVQISAAIAEIAALAGVGGMLVLTSGTFLVDAAGITLASNIRIMGQGDSSIIKLKNSGNGRIITSSATLSNITFENLVFDGNGANQTNGASRDDRSMLQLTNITKLEFRSCTIKNCRHGAALRLAACNQTLLLGNTFMDNGMTDTYGTATSSNATSMTHTGAGWTTNQFAGRVVTMGGSTATITSNTSSVLSFTAWAPTGPTTGIYSIAAAAFIGDHNYNGDADYLRVIGNFYINGTDTGTAQDGIQHSVVANNVYINNELGVSVSNSPTRASRWNVVANNVIRGMNNALTSSVGIKVSSFGNTTPGQLKDVTIQGNEITACDRAMWIDEVDRCIIQGNGLGDAAGLNKQLLLLATGTTVLNGVKIHGNAFYNTSNRGVSFSGGTANDVDIHDNVFSSIGSTPIGATIPASCRIWKNRGFVTEARGTDAIASGTTSKAVTHGMALTPTLINIAFREQGTANYGRWWISAIGATTFTLNVTTDPGASNLDFAWEAEV